LKEKNPMDTEVFKNGYMKVRVGSSNYVDGYLVAQGMLQIV
jgi:hypothetical protein